MAGIHGHIVPISAAALGRRLWFISLVGAALPPALIAMGASSATTVATAVASSPATAVTSATASAVASVAVTSSPASAVAYATASAASVTTSSSLGLPWAAEEALLSIEFRGPFPRKTPAPHLFAVHEF